MKPVTVILLATLFLLIIARIVWKKLRHRVIYAKINEDQMQGEICGLGYKEYINNLIKERGYCDGEDDLKEMFEYCSAADPEAPGQAVMYDETNNLVIVSAAIMARIMRGDDELFNEIMSFISQLPDPDVLVQDWGVKQRRIEM